MSYGSQRQHFRILQRLAALAFCLLALPAQAQVESVGGLPRSGDLGFRPAP